MPVVALWGASVPACALRQSVGDQASLTGGSPAPPETGQGGGYGPRVRAPAVAGAARAAQVLAGREGQPMSCGQAGGGGRRKPKSPPG